MGDDYVYKCFSQAADDMERDLLIREDRNCSIYAKVVNIIKRRSELNLEMHIDLLLVDKRPGYGSKIKCLNKSMLKVEVVTAPNGKTGVVFTSGSNISNVPSTLLGESELSKLLAKADEMTMKFNFSNSVSVTGNERIILGRLQMLVTDIASINDQAENMLFNMVGCAVCAPIHVYVE